MKETNVGKIKRIIYNEENDSLELTIEIDDPKFKKKILRDLDLEGKLSFNKENLTYIIKEDE